MPQFVADLCAGLLMKDGLAGRTIARENRGGFRLVSIRFWRNPTECQNEKTRQKAGFSGVPEILKAFFGTLYGAGTRRTVCFGGARFFGRLEFVGKFGVPQLVTINKSASYGVRWNRTRDFFDVSTLSAC
ncbi:hypothetical protein [Pseudomonas lactis]|uniref:hypothetical protein n=1 Tax=Pseudomonas lactis TaxID=1615674 RepID=UPI0019F004D1|nr:hypothetical protein [Pseudomonas lactis]MBA6042656.1 hypothetical protein [Pseudomonas lactis]